MHKIIFDTFEFDLTPYTISIVEDNHWFSDQFFTKYSFPFNFKLTDDLIAVFGDLLDHNSKFLQTSYEVKYVFGNQLENCVFEIESQVHKEIEATFRYGFDELPNFDKKLADLPLEIIEPHLISNFQNHLKSIIPQKWPNVNYNYPQIFTENYDPSEKTWENFGGIINNYIDDDFLENTEESNEYINRNIIQPLPYVLYVFQQGFLDAGYTLKGSILQSEVFKKMVLFKNDDYFLLAGDIYNVVEKRAIYDEDLGFDEVRLTRALALIPENQYRITGTIAITANYPSENSNLIQSYTKIVYKSSTLAIVTTDILNEASKEIDVTFTTDTDSSPSSQVVLFQSGGDENYLVENRLVFDLKVTRVLGDKASEVVIYEDVDLTRAVPNCTFGKLITEFKNWFNLEIIPKGKDIYIDFIEDDLNQDNAIDLSAKEVLKPRREFNKLESILLKFKDLDNKDYTYTPVFKSKTDLSYNDVDLNSSTKTIEIDAYPLPQINKEGIETAFAFQEKSSETINIALYDGLQNDLNLTIDCTCTKMPEVYEKYHKKWFNFLLSAINYKWLFKMYAEKVATINKKVFAYGRYHVVKSLEKTQISKDLFEVEIETETLE
jgi:hypothetical protein